jgi:hypothetical protein
MGIGKDYGFFQYSSKSSNDISYIATTIMEFPDKDVYLEFDCGGTTTPIRLENCIHIEMVIQIACDYINDGILPNYVQWKTI